MTRRESGSGGGPPRKLGESLGAVVSRLGLHDQDGVATVFGRWEELVGPAVAAHVTPVRLDADALVLEVDHPAWATQVRQLSGTILDRIVEAGAARPARVTVRVRPR